MKLLVLLLSFVLPMAALNLSQVRQAYIAAAKSEAGAKKFASLLEPVTKDDNNKVLVAYKGCSLTLKSKHSNYLPDKISFMKEGAAYLDHAAQSDPQNIEIRMIRLSVQENVPFIVNYRDNIDEDKAMILSRYSNAPKEVKSHVGNYVRMSESFTKEEKAKIK
ncbi:hypothetical protein [Flavobacterium selenitireducens]|uniref:hypothetical protein n=1 Tax=Flavobacterium selenitireducens TaxID=2722704 RepID=UPI00168B59A5|nr:hypothetical protein [Flavobacterium selenitireducens]MBD3583847.1 hypothetical protein [Flavobacterium selenitireducens]